MKRMFKGSIRQIAAVAVVAGLLALTGCGERDSGSGGTPGPSNTPKATNTARATNTSKPTNTPGQAVNTPTPTRTPNVNLAGDYSSTIPFDNGQTANLNLTVQADGQATGTLEVVGPSGTALAAFEGGAAATISLGFATISGTVDSGGNFHFSGNITISGEATTFDLSGNVPLSPGGSGSVTATINGQTHTAPIGLGAGPTPLPTPSGNPTATPIQGGCAHGVFSLTYADVSGGSNLMTTSELTLGKVTAIDSADTGTGTFVWAITASPCTLALGDLGHSIVVQGIGMPTVIQPGTYALGTASPPFLNIVYQETVFNPLNPGGNFLHAWGTTGGTLTITDAGGGALNVQATAQMAEHPLLHGGTGTFTLTLTGTITQKGA